MYYDIVIRYADGRPERHFWNGYPEAEYAYCALPSVGRILRDQAEYQRRPGLTFLDPDVPLDTEKREVRLARDGALVCTVAIAETPVKRHDAGQWGGHPGRKRHSVQDYIGDDGAIARCGQRLEVSRLVWGGGILPNIQMCKDCREASKHASPNTPLD